MVQSKTVDAYAHIFFARDQFLNYKYEFKIVHIYRYSSVEDIPNADTHTCQ